MCPLSKEMYSLKLLVQKQQSLLEFIIGLIEVKFNIASANADLHKSTESVSHEKTCFKYKSRLNL